MHIYKPQLSEPARQCLLEDLENLVRQPTAHKQPPCMNCRKKNSADFDSSQCNSACPEAPTALSEEPLRYPIEDNVVPLVFELTTLRLVRTCWSCEGHLDIDGRLWKIPMVSFFVEKPIYAQLLGNYLNHLHFKGKLNYPWEIILTSYEENWDIAYTIKCNLDKTADPDIRKMQQDLRAMGENLSESIKDLAIEAACKLRKAAVQG